MKRIHLIFSLCLCLLLLSSCGCNHEWQEATCSSPQRCKLCDKTQGSPAEHTWEDATCQKLKTCSVCGQTDGELLPHDWVDATCSELKTCKMCGETEGEKLPHTAGAWNLKKTDYVYAETVKVQTCSVCGEEVDKEIDDIEKLHDGTTFIICVDDFMTRLGNILDGYTGNSYRVKSRESSHKYYGGIVDTSSAVGVIAFDKNEEVVEWNDRDRENSFNRIIAYMDDSSSCARISMGLMQSADPTLSFEVAKDKAKELLNTVTDSGGGITVNGITYKMAVYKDEYFMTISVQ